MGEHDSRQREAEAEELRRFTKKLLVDLHVLERMLREGCIESRAGRIGAEQEMFLVDRDWRPAPVALEVLEAIADPHFTTELGLFNLEANLDPIDLEGACLRRMESRLADLIDTARHAARTQGAEVVLTGILPTLLKGDLDLRNMTPIPRYFALNDAMRRLRGGEFHFRIRGRDELIITHGNVMLESCNTSFQVHFQVSPQDFARRYNVAQVVAAPVLAAGNNSPLLFGRQLWRETRIALFQQSIDHRAPTAHLREQSPRVSFGDHWVDDSVLEIFREDIARFRVLLAIETDEDPFDELHRGRAPKLSALRLHNGTIYRWNRPCYGVSDGKPHLRIENRVLPAGPSVVDEVANAAFWFGLMNGVLEEHGDVRRDMDFDAAKENFLAAARLGMAAQFNWFDRQNVPAQELIARDLLPLARQGLAAMNVEVSDIDRYLGIVEERVRSLKTGSFWLVDSLSRMAERGNRGERMAALVAATCARQEAGGPVHTWAPATLEEAGGWRSHYLSVGQIMTTDLFTVNQDELVDLVAHLMHWEHIRHVPVEDNEHRLVGLVTHRTLIRLMASSLVTDRNRPVPVGEIMHRGVVTARPDTPTLEAIALMRQHRIGCLPVVSDDQRLVGIITERDFMKVAGKLLEEFLSGKGVAGPSRPREGGAGAEAGG